MKNVIAVFVTFLFMNLTFAQEVKIKKGIISIDKKEVAKIEKQDKSYKISSLTDDTYFFAFPLNITPNKNVRLKFWLELTGSNGNVRESEYDEIPFTFGKEKWCVEALLKSNTGLLDKDGVNSQLVKEYFQSSSRGISEQWDAAIIEQKNEIEQEANLAQNDKLVVDSKGNISKDDIKIAVISRVVQDGVYKLYNYTVSDSKGKKIATSSFYRENDHNRSGISIKMFDGTVYPLEQVKTSMSNIDFDDFEKRMVRKIYAKGYNLSDIAKSNKVNVDAATTTTSEEVISTNNILDIKGYVIDAKNVRLEGMITFIAEPDNQSNNNGMVDVSSYGTSVTIRYDDKKKTFKSKDGVKFCANGLCYIGVQGSEDGGLNNSSSEFDVFGGSSKFFKVVYENVDNYVLVHNNSPKDFYLKLKKEKKAVYLGDRAMFGKRKEDKTKKIFDEYVGCTSINFANYNTNSIDGLTKVIQDYIATCK